MDIQHSSGNVFADTGCSNPAALQLKARLMIAIDNHLKSQQWSPAESAHQLNLPPARLHSLLDQQFNAFSLDEIIELAAALQIRLELTSPNV